ncbi:hypothetical protein JTE90_025507 [Oedothorax gibbosus]|uniref:Eukaryotic translation initiation factor 4 gamma 3 n=1 Tax=Oedothorax gibbosus TaxID=931172 RepID=A0AAV6TUS7_9ARAC|nr:hypothetical protein JTE90_025507 [Oedothorax gibbosus]
MQSSHADFGQAGYSQQYGFPQTLPSVPSNPGHDMSKQVAAGQSAMYTTSGGMTAQVQHHQSTMGGPVSAQQASSLVQRGQQINQMNPTVVPFPAYVQRNPASRPMAMGRSPMNAVVSQTGQQSSSHFSPMQMIGPSSSSFGPQVMMYQNQYPQGRPPQGYPSQYIISPPNHQPYVNGFIYQQPANSNGYYPQHTIPSFNSVTAHTPQMPPQQIPAQQPPQPQQKQTAAKRTCALSIINPETGKNIFDEESGDSVTGSVTASVKESENFDPSVGIEFAKQVAKTISEPLVVGNLLRDKCPAPLNPPPEFPSKNYFDPEIKLEKKWNTSEIVVAEDTGDLADTESIMSDDYRNSRSKKPQVLLSKKDNYPISINESDSYDYETSDSQMGDTFVPATPETHDHTVYDDMGVPQPETTEDLIRTESGKDPEVSSVPEIGVECQEIPENIQSTEPGESRAALPDVVQPVTAPDNLNNEEIVTEASIEVVSSLQKMPDKASALESKKNKAKKKKDYNKKGESKEGGEMDAFLVDNKPEATPVSPTPVTVAPVPTILAPVERMLSPVPIVDSDILATIPFPEESENLPPQNDISPSDPTSEASSVSPSAESEDKENVSDDPSKIVLKYSYKEDQWSPLNPEGKKQYDRDFLLQLQGQPMSLCKPTNLPNLDVIKDKAHIQRLTEVNRVVPQIIPQVRYNDPFMPQYARTGAPRLPHPPINRRSQQGRGGEKPRKIISFSSSLTQNIKLHESENAWKPLNKLSLSDIAADELEKEKLKRSVQGVLNKLTPQKFETLLAQLKGLNIDTEEKLNVVIDLIFEKAVDEPNFSVPYANLCKHLAMIKVPVADQGGGQVNFRKLLLTKCQKEFEQDRSDELKHEERMKALEEAEPDKQKEMKLEFDLEEKKMRYRQLGNIRFIGELFKLGMLIEPIMHECIKKLLSQGDEESLECLCKLLKTIGKELDDSKGSKSSRDQSPMDLYFAQMQKYVDKRLTSSRVRFMLQDVIDLKKCSWVPRRDENMPKTIDQIHQEAEREAREQQINLQNMSSSNYPKRMPDDRDRRKASGRNNMSDDGWTPSSSKSNKGSYSALDPTKLKLTKPDEVDSIRLGPGGRGPSSWGRGSSGGNKTTPEEVKTATNNRYSALESLPNYDGRRGSQRSAASSRESSRGRSNQLSTAARKTSSTSKEREDLLETVKVFNKPADAKAQDAKKNDAHVNGKAADPNDLSLRGPEYNDEEMERKTKPLIDEFLHNNDFEEAIKCVTELASPNTVHMFINTAINQVLERSSQARYSLGQLLFSLLKKKIISFEQYKKGVGSVLEIIDDYALDIPLIWDYMGEILEPMIEDAEFPLTFLKEVLQPCIPSEKAGLLVSAILHCSAKRKGTIKLGEFWKESGLQWTDFLEPGADVNEFIRKHKLEFTVSPTKVKPNVQMTTEEIKKKLISLLKENEANESVFDWIDANVSGNSEPAFIRALVTAVHEHVITGSGANCELSNQQLKNRTALLTRYINHNEKLELQALYAIQALMNQLGQPSGLLRQIFDILYDDDVITEETFKVWESSTDPNESEGKGVAVHSVKSFFTWLRESESGEEPEE